MLNLKTGLRTGEKELPIMSTDEFVRAHVPANNENSDLFVLRGPHNHPRCSPHTTSRLRGRAQLYHRAQPRLNLLLPRPLLRLRSRYH